MSDELINKVKNAVDAATPQGLCINDAEARAAIVAVLEGIRQEGQRNGHHLWIDALLSQYREQRR